MRKLNFKKGETICSTSDDNSLFFINDGLVRLYFLDDDGREVSFELLRKGDVFSISKGEVIEFAEAFSDCELIAIEREDILSWDSEVLTKILFSFLQRYSEAKMRAKILLTLPLEKRIEKVAIYIAQKLDTIKDGFAEVPLSHEEFASFLCATRECVSKALGELSKRGIVKTERRKIVFYITDSLNEID